MILTITTRSEHLQVFSHIEFLDKEIDLIIYIKVINNSLCNSSTNQSITIYSHRPIGLIPNNHLIRYIRHQDDSDSFQ